MSDDATPDRPVGEVASVIDAPLLAGTVRSTADRLTHDATAGVVRPWVSTHLEQDVRSVARFEQYGQEFTFRADESVDRAGQGSAPSPMRYLLSGIAFCVQVWCAKSAAMHGLPVADLRVDVRTFLDMRGEHLVGAVPAHPQWFVVDVSIHTDAGDADAVVTVVTEALRRCPVSSLVTRAVPVHLVVRRNGVVVHDARPDELRTEHEEVLGR